MRSTLLIIIRHGYSPIVDADIQFGSAAV